MTISKEEFDRIQTSAKKLREIFQRDNVGGLNGMEDYLVRAVEEATQSSGKTLGYKASFLWPHKKDSVEEAGYEFANAQTEEYRMSWWETLLYRVSENY